MTMRTIVSADRLNTSFEHFLYYEMLLFLVYFYLRRFRVFIRLVVRFSEVFGSTYR